MGLDTDLPKLIQEQEVNPNVRCLFYQTSDNPTVAIHGSILAGTSSEKPAKSGIAELTARLLIRGSRKLSATRIADLLESVGATASFRNSQDSIVFQARMTSDWTMRVLGIVAECLTRPALSASDVSREKEGLLTDIRLRDDDTTRRGLRELSQLVYPAGHPYRRDRLGAAESVIKIGQSDVKKYVDDVVSGSPVLIAFAGHFKKEEAVTWTRRTFGERDPKQRTDQSPARNEPQAAQKDVVMPHKTQSDILIGGMASSRTHPDYEPLNLLNAILGELGFMGRLGERVRDKEGLAYSCSSFVNSGLYGGSWTALAGVNPRNVTKALALMKEEIVRVGEELVGEQELEDAKQNQIGSALMELESTDGIARTSHNLAHFGLGMDYFTRRRNLFAEITREDLLAMGKKYLDGANLSTVIVGPRAKGESKS